MSGATARGALAAIVAALSLAGFPAQVSAETRAEPRRDLGAPITFSVDEGTMFGVARAPDGKTLAIDLQGTIYRLPASGGKATAITDTLYDAHQMSWSPDGRRIAFQSNRRGIWHIWSMAADGSDPIEMTDGLQEDREPAYSPDGKSLAFASNRGGQYDIWIMDLATGGTRRLTTHPDNDYAPSWSPDGRSLFFVSDRKDAPGIYTIAVQGDGERLQYAASGVQVASPSASPDGRHLAYVVVAGGKATMMVDGKPAIDGHDVFAFRPQWDTPTSFLYTADGRIKRYSLGDGASATIAFSADLTVRRTHYAARVTDFDDAAAQPVRGIRRPVLSPDGKSIAFVALGDLWAMPIGGAPTKLTDDAAEDRDPAWSPDGRYIAYSSDRDGPLHIFIRDRRTGLDRRLTGGDVAEARPSWSRDGRQIAYMVESGGYRTELRVADAATGASRPLQGVTFGSGYPSWSADGKVVMTSELVPTSTRYRQGTTQIRLSPVDGSLSRLVTPVAGTSIGKRTGDGPAWSPDGRRIAFAMADALWVADVAATGDPVGKPLKVSDDAADSLSWSGDSDHLLYLDADQLKIVSIRTGAVRRIAMPLTWKPARGKGRLVIHAGLLIDGIHPQPRRDMDIVIDGNRIVAIGPHRAGTHRGGRLIDASDRAVMPGLFEAHAHEMPDMGDKLGRALLAYGVTSVRSMANDPSVMAEDRESWASGRRDGPRLFGTGYLLDGRYTYYESAVPVTTESEVDKEVDRAARLRYGLLKTYVNLDEPLRARAIAGAHAIGIPTASHEIYPAASFGQDTVEHLSGTASRGFSTKTSTLGIAYGDVLQILARSGMAITPTAVLGAYDTTPPLAGELQEPRWKNLQTKGTRDKASSGEPWLPGNPAMLATVAANFGKSILAMHRSGVTILAGTDAPIMPFGLGLHKELEVFVRSGLTPFEALQTATVNVAKTLHVDRDLGTIEVNKLADIVVIDGNPLTDIRDARRVRTVIKNGIVMPVEDIVAGRRQ